MDNANIAVPWVWYTMRSMGIVAYLLLYFSVFFGLIIRLPFLSKHFIQPRTYQFHCWISFQATVFAFFHGFLLLFDLQRPWFLAEIFLPFASQFKPAITALGIIGLYLMTIITMTSYLKSKISQNTWRTVHYFNAFLYIGVSVHMYLLGTDMKMSAAKATFWIFNAVLLLLLLLRISSAIKNKKPILAADIDDDK
jgi:methionine sulfoxide reductase heme-binding subunit